MQVKTPGICKPTARVIILRSMHDSRQIDHRRICMRIAVAVAVVAMLSSILLQLVIASSDLSHRLGDTLMPELFFSMRICGAVAAATLVFILWVRRKPSITPGLTGVVHVLVVLFGCWWVDRAVGMAFPPPPPDISLLAPHPVRGWCLKPSMEGRESGTLVRTNQLGLRGAEVSSPKPPDELRLLFLGDSIIFGFGLQEGEGIVPQSESALSKVIGRSRVVCINAGVSGYATWQERSYFEDEGVRLDPDVVVLGLSMQNDVSDEVLTRAGEFRRSPIAFEFSNSAHSSGIIRAIASLRARKAWNARVDAIPWKENSEREALFKNHGSFRAVFAEPMMDEFKAAQARVLAELSRIADLCAARQIPFALVIFSPRERTQADMDDIQPERVFLEWAASRRVPALDMHSVLRKRCGETGVPLKSLYLDESHFTTKGCAIIAQGLAEFLQGLPGIRPIHDGSVKAPTSSRQ